MVARASRGPAPCNWLKELDSRIRGLPAEHEWFEDSDLLLQRCRLFITTRFPQLPRLVFDDLLRRETSRGEKLLEKSTNAARVLLDLDSRQRNQLAGLVLDIAEALQHYTHHRFKSKIVHEHAVAADRQTRMLSRKVSKILSECEDLRTYAKRIGPLLGLEHFRVADRCLKWITTLKGDDSSGAFYRSLKSESRALEDPWQLGLIELYWFFRHECGRSGLDSEVRTAMIANDLVAGPERRKLKYRPKYEGAESQGCSAVRIAVARYRPRTKP